MPCKVLFYGYIFALSCNSNSCSEKIYLKKIKS